MSVDNYNKLKKKYNLPELDKLVESLELEIEKDKGQPMILQTIRNSITDRLYDLMKIVESIIFTGEGSDPNLLYQEHMVKEVSHQAFEIYKTLNVLHYQGMKLRFLHERKKDAEFIRKIFGMWPELEKTLFVFFGALEKGWKEIDIEKEIKAENYHG